MSGLKRKRNVREAKAALRILGRPAKRRFMVTKRSIANLRTGGFLGIENKFIDYTFSDAMVSTPTGGEMDPPGAGAQTTPGCISALAIGDSESNRDGRKATLTSVHVRGVIQLDATASSTLAGGLVARVVLLHDTQTNAQQFNGEDVFLPATNKEDSFRNLGFVKRFKILGDKTIVINVAAAAGNGTANDTPNARSTFRFNKKLNIPVIHVGTTAVVGSISDNSLHMMAFTNGATATMSYESRVRFVG